MMQDITNEEKKPKASFSGNYDSVVEKYFGQDKRSLGRKNKAQWVIEQNTPYKEVIIEEHTRGWTGKSLQKDGFKIFRIGGVTYGGYSYGLFISIKPK